MRRQDRPAHISAVLDFWRPQNGPDCPYCGRRMTNGFQFWPTFRTVDHILPLSRRGTHAAANVVLVCRACNREKADLDGFEWLAFLYETDRWDDFLRTLAAYQAVGAIRTDVSPHDALMACDDLDIELFEANERTDDERDRVQGVV